MKFIRLTSLAVCSMLQGVGMLAVTGPIQPQPVGLGRHFAQVGGYLRLGIKQVGADVRLAETSRQLELTLPQ